MTVQEVLRQYDRRDRKGFYLYELRNSLSKVSDEEKTSDVYKYEMLAFSLFWKGFDNDWGIFYDPLSIERGDGGVPMYQTPLDAITMESVLYWETRFPNTENPLLKMQYSSLVWDFKKKLGAGQYPSSLYDTYLNSMLEVIDGDYEPRDSITLDIIERLSDFVKTNAKYKDAVKQTLLRFNKERASDDNAVRLWGAYLRFIVKHKSWFNTEEETDCVKKHESRLERLYNADNCNPWLIEEQVKALADYYKSREKKGDLIRVLRISERAFKAAKERMTSIQWMGNIEQVANLYSYYGLKEDRTRLLKEVEQAGGNAITQMKSQSFEMEIPSEAFEQQRKLFLKDSKAEQYELFCHYFIPDKDYHTQELKRLAGQSPFSYMIPTRLMDPQGHPLSVVGGIEEDFEGQFVLHLSRHIEMESIFLRHGINVLKESGALSNEFIMSNVKLSPIIEINRQETIRKALNAYDSQDYITMCHLLIPQIEAAFRSLIEKCGKAVIRPKDEKSKGGYCLRTLDDILRDDVINDKLGKDFALYSRILLTDQRGLNVRNNLCHGLVAPDFFNYLVADRLIHLFCSLTLVR